MTKKMDCIFTHEVWSEQTGTREDGSTYERLPVVLLSTHQEALQSKDAEIVELRKQHDVQVRAIFDDLEKHKVHYTTGGGIPGPTIRFKREEYFKIKKKYLGEAKKE